MEQGIHELSAAYALHALAPDEQEAFEEHLAHCEECRRHVAAFQETTAVMAYELEAPAPPAALRNRIIERAHAERPNVVPLRRRWTLPTATALAAAATVAAVAFGVWALTLNSSLSDERAASDQSARVVSILAEGDHIPLEGANGSLVVAPSGGAALVVSGLEAAPEDKTYEAWVIEDNKPRPAGLFRGGGPSTVFELTEEVPEGAVVAVTSEPAGGSDQPTSDPLFATSRAA